MNTATSQCTASTTCKAESCAADTASAAGTSNTPFAGNGSSPLPASKLANLLSARKNQMQIHAYELMEIILAQEHQLEAQRLQLDLLHDSLQTTREHLAMLTETVVAPNDNPFLQKQAV